LGLIVGGPLEDGLQASICQVRALLNELKEFGLGFECDKVDSFAEVVNDWSPRFRR
jgi:hypothetical protein